MEVRTLGSTGLKISRLGMGLARIGAELAETDLDEAGQVLNRALDAGINFLDTAACYGFAEEMIGRTVAHRRDEYVLATKCGHVTDDPQRGHVNDDLSAQPWTARVIEESVARSLIRMKTDHMDLLQLHSCSVDVLKQGEVIEALLKAKRSGQTRFIGYSGDNEAALWAVESDLFDTLQTSYNMVDQHARTKLFDVAMAKGMGIIIKRPVANGAWGVKRTPYAYASEYFRRARIMAQIGPIPGAPDDDVLLATGFVFAHSAVDTAIVGTRNPLHMTKNIEMVQDRLPISTEVVQELHRRFDQVEDNWVQLT